MVQGCHDSASRFVYIMTKGKRKYLLEEDFTDLIQVSCDGTRVDCIVTAGCVSRISLTLIRGWHV